MTDQLPSKALTIALERVAEYRKTRHMIGMPYQEFMIALADEITRLRTTLRGISTCSTCEVCRGAALRALGEPTKEQAFRAALGPSMYEEIYGAKPDPGPMGTCCYGGRKLRGDCASCAAWRADPPPPVAHSVWCNAPFLASAACTCRKAGDGQQ